MVAAGPPAAAFDGEADERSTSASPGKLWAAEADAPKNRHDWLQIALVAIAALNSTQA